MLFRILILLLLSATAIFSQNIGVGIGDQSDFVPDASSILELKSVSRGFLMTRMTRAERLAIISPAHGLMVIQTDNVGGDLPGIWYYNSSLPAWVYLSSSASSPWTISGNSASNPLINFVGNTDAVDLVFRTSNIERMRILSSGDVNINNGLRISNASNFYNNFITPSGQVLNITYTLPQNSGTNGNVLSTDGSGNLTWVSNASSNIGFDNITTGTNLTASMTVGVGASILAGGGNIQSNQFIGSGSTTNAIDLATAEVSGIVSVDNGGTGLNSVGQNYLLYGSGGSTLNSLAPVNNSFLTTSAAGVPQWTNYPAGGFEPAITSGTVLQYWRGDKSWQTLNTTVVPEGTNLYYTDNRARAAISGTAPILYNNLTGIISISQANGTTNGYLSSADWNTFNSNLHPRLHTMTSTTDHSAGNWKVFYSDASGQVQELALGANNTFLRSNGPTVAPSWAATGGGGVTFATLVGGTNTFASMTVGTGASLQVTGNGIIQATEFMGNGSTSSSVDLNTNEVNGTLPVNKGGTGTNTLTGMLKGNGASAITGITNTPNNVAYWTDANTIGGSTNLTWDNTSGSLALYNGKMSLTNTNNTASELKFNEPSGSGANFTTFKATIQSADINYVLPDSQATASTYSLLGNNGTGALSWMKASDLGGSSVNIKIVPVNSDYTATAIDMLIVITTNGRTVTLPSAAAYPGKVYYVVLASAITSGNVTAIGGQTIEYHTTSQSINMNTGNGQGAFSGCLLVSDGSTKWYIISTRRTG